MKIFRYMWTASSLDLKRKKLLEELKQGSVSGTVYLVVLPESSSHVLDILKVDKINKTWLDVTDSWVIGAASDKEEAEDLAGGIVSRAVKATGQADVRAYLAPVLTKEAEA